MAVPDYQSFMLPILRLMADGKEHSLVELHGRLAGEMNLTSADLEERLPSGTQTKYSKSRPMEHSLSRQGRGSQTCSSRRAGDK